MLSKRFLSLALAVIMAFGVLTLFASCKSEGADGADNKANVAGETHEENYTNSGTIDGNGNGTGEESGDGNVSVDPKEDLPGKYTLYHQNVGGHEMNYYQLYYFSGGNKNIELHKDGKVSGDIPDGYTWSAEKLTYTTGDGKTSTITVKDKNMIVIADESVTLTYVKEGDPRLGNVPTVYKILYDHVMANGTVDGNDRTATCRVYTDGTLTTITATSDGKIKWKYARNNGIYIEMEVLENEQFQTLTFVYPKGMMDKDYTCVAKFNPALVEVMKIDFISYVQTPDTSQYGTPNAYKSLMGSYATLMFAGVNDYIKTELGMSLRPFGFSIY